jgi:hypothetical protein
MCVFAPPKVSEGLNISPLSHPSTRKAANEWGIQGCMEESMARSLSAYHSEFIPVSNPWEDLPAASLQRGHPALHSRRPPGHSPGSCVSQRIHNRVLFSSLWDSRPPERPGRHGPGRTAPRGQNPSPHPLTPHPKPTRFSSRRRTPPTAADSPAPGHRQPQPCRIKDHRTEMTP